MLLIIPVSGLNQPSQDFVLNENVEQVIVTGNENDISSAAAPVANFYSSTTSGPAPLTIAFSDKSTNSPTGWAWFFGDEDWTKPTWTIMNDSGDWSGGWGHSSVVLPDGSIVLMGGWQFDSYNDVWRSTDNGATWTKMTTNAGWSARFDQSSVVLPDGSIVLMGGYGSGLKNDVWRSTDKGATWTEMTTAAEWSPRTDHCSVALPDGSIVLMGGNTGGISDNKNDVWRSTDKGATWTKMTESAGWWPREDHSCVAMPDGSIVLMGGTVYGRGYMRDVWRSTDKGATWTEMSSPAEWSGRFDHKSVAMPDGSILLMGGNTGSYNCKNDVWRSTDNGATWTEITTNAGWSPRYSPGCVAMPDGSIVIIGGGTGSSNRWDVWRFMPAGSSEKNPSHTYSSDGTYKVSLQSYNSGGYNSLRKIGYISVGIFPPTITSITPASGQQGGKHIVTITGTNFQKDNVKVTVSGKGVTVGAYKTRSTNKITVLFTIAKTASTGVRTVKVTNPSSGLKVTKKFTVTGAPKITKVNPTSGKQGKTVKITLTGKNFEKDKSIVTISGKGVSVKNYVTRTKEKIVAMFKISQGAATTKRTVTIKNPTWGVTTTAPLKFTVLKAKGNNTSQVEPDSSINNGILSSPVLSSSQSISSSKSPTQSGAGLIQVTPPAVV